MSNSKESKQPYIDQPVDGVTPINVDNAQGAVTEEIRKRFLLGSKTGNLCIRGDASKGLWAGDVSFDGAVANSKWWVKLDGTSSGGGYNLPIASASVLGGIKVGSGLSIDAGTGVLSATGKSKVSAYNNSVQTFSLTPSVVNYNTEVFDTNDEFDPSTGIFTAKAEGYYFVSASYSFFINPANPEIALIKIETTGGSFYNVFSCVPSGLPNDYYQSAQTSGTVYLAIGDQIKIYATMTVESHLNGPFVGYQNLSIHSI